MPITTGTYGDRFRTCGTAGLQGVPQIVNDGFSPVIEKALSLIKTAFYEFIFCHRKLSLQTFFTGLNTMTNIMFMSIHILPKVPPGFTALFIIFKVPFGVGVDGLSTNFIPTSNNIYI